MLEDPRQRTMEDLIPLVLDILARNQKGRFDSKMIAKELKTETEEINHCFEEMRYLKLIELFTCFGPRYEARITPLGLANLADNKDSMEKKNG
jgi:hypothetical protein